MQGRNELFTAKLVNFFEQFQKQSKKSPISNGIRLTRNWQKMYCSSFQNLSKKRPKSVVVNHKQNHNHNPYYLIQHGAFDFRSTQYRKKNKSNCA